MCLICVRAGKRSWPELVGVKGTVAEATIERENSLVNAIVVPQGSGVTADFRCDRVWVFYNNFFVGDFLS